MKIKRLCRKKKQGNINTIYLKNMVDVKNIHCQGRLLFSVHIVKNNLKTK